MKNLVFLTVFLTSIQTFASLPPYWDSVKQIEAVMNSQELSKKVSSAITIVKRLGNLRFEVNTEFCSATVLLVAHPPSNEGPTSYSFKSIEKIYCE